MEDIMIFGKNRHFFGGIEPSSMIEFSAKLDEYGHIVIEGTPPSDTIIEGQTLCTVDGVIICRRNDKYPKDEFDGEKVADIKGTEPFQIVDPEPYDDLKAYYYAAFPYSKQGVYNRSNDNRTSLNIPEPMKMFSLSVEMGPTHPSIIINVEFPDNVDGGVIRKSTLGYPIDENDGELVDVRDNTFGADKCTDSNVEYGVTYYYSIFPYRNGVYFYNNENRASKQVTKYTYLFGYDIDLADSNPATRVSYPSDVDNYEFTPAAMDFTADTFNYGSWPSEAGDKFMPRPCMLKYDGTVDHYLDPSDYTKKVDGTNSNVTSTSSGANAMMEWSKIWTKRWEENGIYHFRCSDSQIDDEYECWCNYDKNDNQIDHFYTSIYMASKAASESHLRSYGAAVSPAAFAVDTQVLYAKENGEGWNVGLVSDWFLIQDLLVMMAKTTDGQTAYGNGISSTGNSGDTVSNGALNEKGLFWGSKIWGTSGGVKVFGMEHWWGNGNKYVAGLIYKNKKYYMKLTRGTKDGSTVNDYSTSLSNTDGYISIGTQPTLTASQYEYISDMETLPFGRIPITVTGSSNTYEADSVYNNGSQGFAQVGGPTNNGNGNGPFTLFLSLGNATGTYTTLSCKPALVVDEEV